jgi:hypothetical protein
MCLLSEVQQPCSILIERKVKELDAVDIEGIALTVLIVLIIAIAIMSFFL